MFIVLYLNYELLFDENIDLYIDYIMQNLQDRFQIIYWDDVLYYLEMEIKVDSTKKQSHSNTWPILRR